MAQYKVLRKCFLQESRSIGPRQYNPGDIIEFDGPAPEFMEPVGGGDDHEAAPRRYDIEGGTGLGLLKRAEMSSTRR